MISLWHLYLIGLVITGFGIVTYTLVRMETTNKEDPTEIISWAFICIIWPLVLAFGIIGCCSPLFRNYTDSLKKRNTELRKYFQTQCQKQENY